MKNIFKRLFCIVLCLIILSSFFACGFNESEETDDTTSTTADSETENTVFALTAGNLKEYKIIVPDKLMKDLSGAVDQLQNYITAVTDTEPEVKSDFISEGSDIYCETEYEIIIGNANRSEAAELYKSVRNKDSGYALVDKKLLIFGDTEDLVKSSVKLFNKEVLSKADNAESVLLYSGENKLVQGAYNSQLKINGVNISEYTVVYPASPKLQEKTIATELCKWIEINAGYSINCVSDTAEPSKYEISVGDTNRITDAMKAENGSKLTSSDSYLASKHGDLLWVTGKTANAISRAATALISSADQSGEVGLDPPVSGEIKDLSITVMSYNIRGMLDADKRDSEGVIDSIKQRDPDIFAAQEAVSDSGQAANWISRLDASLGDKYDSVKGLFVGTYNSYLPVYYKKDKFELVSQSSKYLTHTPDKRSQLEGSDYYRTVTFVVLRDKQTGIEFLYSNNHFDTAGYIIRTEEAKILSEMLACYPLIPQIVGGDFNTDSSTTPIQTLTSKTGLKVGEKIAAEAILGGSGANDYTTRGDSIIDMVLVTPQSIAIQKYEIWDNRIDGKYPSDHLPVYLELTISY